MIDFNKFVDKFTQASISVEDVHWAIIQPGGCNLGYKTSVYAFVFPIRGKADFIFNGNSTILDPSKVINTGPNESLDQYVLGQNKWEYYVIHYTVANETEEDKEILGSLYEFNIGDNPKIIEMLRNIYNVSKNPGSISDFHVKTLFYDIVYEVFISHRNRLNSDSEEMIKETINYINEHYRDPITLEFLANRYEVKADKFSYLFNKYTGIRPINYLIIHRMKLAEELLIQGDSSINKIAESVGYSDAYYFSRIFKKHKGLSPSSVKRSFNNNPLMF